ncbi:MAG: hypothetical protein PUB09_00535 [Firmicutes bacterium]|nr:hypothetical protein [Bacillota bacterium]
MEVYRLNETERVKYFMEKAVQDTVDEYNAKEENKFKFAKPICGYADTTDVRFDAFFTRLLCQHPKALYRPGCCAFVFYLPFEEDQVGNYDAFYAGMRLAMEVNRAVREALRWQGRLSSLCSSMADWSKVRCHYEWDNKIAGAIAGIGQMGPGGSFHTEAGCSGRVGVILFDKPFAEKEELNNEQLEAMIQKYYEDCKFQEAGNLECSDEMIAACPGGAITKEGIDRKKCQEYCMTINSALPDPELCGKCFRCK